MEHRSASAGKAAAASLLLITATATAARADAVSIDAVKDNTLYEDPAGATSNGAGQHFFAGNTDESAIRRGLIQFDIAAAVPAGATIDSVTLTLNMSRTIAGPEPVALMRALQEWGEGTSDANRQEGQGTDATPGDATWLNAILGTSDWAAAGGDFMTVSSASITVDDVGFYTWGSTADMVIDVQGWLDDPASNFGWVLVGNEAAPATAKRFDTRENPDATVRPVLTVEYTPGGVLPTVYESPDRALIVAPVYAVGTASASPYDHVPAVDPLLFYQVDDGTGNPPLIRMVKGGSGVRIHF